MSNDVYGVKRLNRSKVSYFKVVTLVYTFQMLLHINEYFIFIKKVRKTGNTVYLMF